MAKEYRTRAFKSGNSLAIRLPKAFGFVDGDDVTLAPHADGSFSFWKDSKKLDVLMSLYGAFSSGFMADGRGNKDQAERDWSDPASRHRAA